MRVAVVSAERYDRELLDAANRELHREPVCFDSRPEPGAAAGITDFERRLPLANAVRGDVA